MRELYEEIQEYYLLIEGLSKEPSSPIVANKYHNHLSTQLTKYKSISQFHPSNEYHKDFNGAVHDVSWDTIHDPEKLTSREKIQTFHDAAHLHHHFIKYGTKVGDIVTNTPTGNINKNKKTKKNKRESIYRSYGFGAMNKDEIQHGIIKQHPHDHPDESKRGQKYLHPLEQYEIDEHGDKPSAGANDNTIRHLSSNYGNNDNYTEHQTKLNNVVHTSYKYSHPGRSDEEFHHDSDEWHFHPNNKKDLQTSHLHHQAYINAQKNNSF